MSRTISTGRALAVGATLLILEMLATSVAAPAELRLRWSGGGAAVDRARFPDPSQPGWIDVEISTHARIAGGALGFRVIDPTGSGNARLDPGDVPPPGTPAEKPARFDLPAWESGRVRVPLRISVEGEARPITIEATWVVLETPLGPDTLGWEPDERPALTVLGGCRAPAATGVVQLAPGDARPGEAITLLGHGLERAEAVCLRGPRGVELLLPADRARESFRMRARLPIAIPPGVYAILVQGRPQACGMIRIEAGGRDEFQEPLWDAEDGDVLVIAADALAGAGQAYADDLRERGLRPAFTRMSLVTRDYGDQDRAESVRLAVAEAYESFASRPLALVLIGTASEDEPGLDLVPTRHVDYAHEYPDWYDATLADDGDLGDVVDPGGGAPELIVGRIPARSAAEMAAYRQKLAAYDAQAPRSGLLFVVGDASINRDNSDRRRAAEELAQIVEAETDLAPASLLASSYMPLSSPANRQRAHDDFLASLAAGAGIVEIFGNNTGALDIAHMLAAPPSQALPWTLPSEMPTQDRLPIALFHTCLNGAFDEEAHFEGFDSPVEAWVRDPLRGAVAAIAQSHLTEFFDDVELAGQILRRMGAGDGAMLGAIHAGARASLLTEWSRGNRSVASVRMANLIGDPFIVPRLGLEVTRLDGTFEVSGAWPVQNAIEEARGWTTPDLSCATAKLVHAGILQPECGAGSGAPVEPVGGERMLRLEASFEAGQSRRAVAWKIFNCAVTVREGSRLRYMVRQESDRRGTGSLCVEAITASGRLLSGELFDASGLPSDPAAYRYELRKWHPVLVRLDAWAGETIVALYARYEDDGRAAGDHAADQVGGGVALREDPLPAATILGALDEVRIEPGEVGPLVDPAFDIDEDGDGSPDFWPSPPPGNRASMSGRGLSLPEDGIMTLHLAEAPGGGVMQLLGPRPHPDLPLRLFLEARSLDGGSLRVATVDPRSGAVHDQTVLAPLGARWSQWVVELVTPGPPPSALLLAAESGTAGVRALSWSDYLRSAPPRKSPSTETSIRVGPNPTRGPIYIEAIGSTPVRGAFEIFDATGRRRACGAIDLSPGGIERIDLGAIGLLRPAAGVYYMRIETPEGRQTRCLRIVR